MSRYFLGFHACLILFALVLVALEVGRQLGKYHAKRNAATGKGDISTGVIEGAVFGLMGLFLAFFFSGAYTRFDVRRNLITTEMIAIKNAYLQADLLDTTSANLVHREIRDYLHDRIMYYEVFSTNFPLANQYLLQSKKIQLKLWQDTITNSNPNSSRVNAALLAMINAADIRMITMHIHPPMVIFYLFLTMSIVSALLAGYNIGGKKAGSPIHMIVYALLMAFTIYLTIDMEYPRSGFLTNINSFDYFLAHALDNSDLPTPTNDKS